MASWSERQGTVRQMTEIIATYRGYLLIITDHDATGETFDFSGDNFECHRQTDAVSALRAAVRKIEQIKGPEKWNESYTNEALK